MRLLKRTLRKVNRVLEEEMAKRKGEESKVAVSGSFYSRHYSPPFPSLIIRSEK